MKQSRMSSTAATVGDYLRGLPRNQRVALGKLRKTILAAAPGAEETISYAMPAYKLHGVLVYFAAFADHCSLFPAGKGILRQFAKELRPFDASGATIRFTPDRPIPAALVRRIVRARVRENEERHALRTARRKG